MSALMAVMRKMVATHLMQTGEDYNPVKGLGRGYELVTPAQTGIRFRKTAQFRQLRGDFVSFQTQLPPQGTGLGIDKSYGFLWRASIT
jgi:hypothetical protein